ncbi:glycoside hydrolase family 3 protein [Streptomyces silvisoli]|uniref:beta-N-acetylhexosaminidase n=1 Tax=Streptomyces silvisoli TaxID=3034235 RepID=A0ABT5ZV22_9ACTN|nr:glycoside hydrolase family 3 protein [Streptomyces silvisoli]MDF3293662.1 glycoside hydrolase family 3 N-terminal domain-containing protein [Streptomyces silvisoli]
MRAGAVTTVLLTAAAVTVGTAAAPLATATDHQVNMLMTRMTLPEKVSQLFVSEVYGATATTTDPVDVAANHRLYGADVGNGAQLLSRYHLGGVIYFSWSDNLNDPRQITALSAGLQHAATAAPGGVPLQISTDQEGGTVNRIGAPLAVSPGNMAIGATFDPAAAYRAASVSGAQLRALGINTDDAPVVDVNTNPLNSADGPRAFGDRTGWTARFAAAAVRGYAASGVGAQAKHFPGLGDTTVNTDNGVAVTHETRAQIMARDVPPFRAAIAAGVPSIMAAHIVAPSLDPSGLPASLSRPIVTGLLRGTLHYDGVVITDALSAAALAGIAPDQVVLDAISAGDDELLMPPDLPGAVHAVLNAVRTGMISTARIDQSVHRILRMKAQLGLLQHRYPAAPRNPFDAPGVMAGIARRSITLLRDTRRVLPLTAHSGTRVLVTGWGTATTLNLANALAAQGLATDRLWTGSPDQHAIDTAVAAARAHDVTVVTSYNAWSDSAQQSLVRQLLATGRPIVVASVGGPYDIAYFPTATTYLAAYDYQPVSVTALANTLLGTAPTGKLPVSVRQVTGGGTLFAFGSGIGYQR